MPAQSVEQKLPLSTAILSDIAIGLLMWNLALRLAFVLGRWAAGGAMLERGLTANRCAPSRAATLGRVGYKTGLARRWEYIGHYCR